MKKILSLILTVILIFSLCIPAFSADEADDIIYSDLKKYNIFVGDENGDLHLEDSLTRAEFCKMLIVEMGLDVINYIDPTENFIDVSPEHWAINDINFAYSMGIINGIGNNMFAPDDAIIYQDMIKMIVSALGYAPEAEKNGGYPSGYISVAAKLGLTADIAENIAITRADAALCMYRALDVPHMDQFVYGSDPQYMILDGKDGRPYKSFRKELEYVLEYKANMSEE